MKRAIVYIRVSTDEQAERGHSLGYQEATIKKYCQLKEILIDKLYKEDYSAKTFDRPEFNSLLEYCKKHRDHIDTLLVLKWDRFSRNATESYAMIKQLNDLGIEINAVEQPLDLSVPENKFMLAFYLTAPEVENDRRSLNVKAGMKQALKKGKWLGKVPIGYWKDRNDDETIKLTDEAELIMKAFHLILKGNKIVEVSEEIGKKGLKLGVKRWSKILRNPFYAGYMKFGLIEGIIKGNHEGVISLEEFNEVQDILNEKATGQHTIIYDFDRPLKVFSKCAKCKKSLSAYEVKSKGLWYYKCPTIGCKTNISEKKMHKGFELFLSQFKVEDDLIAEVKSKLLVCIEDFFKDQQLEKQNIKSSLTKLDQRIENLELKFIDSKIDSETYKKHKDRFSEEKSYLSKQLTTVASEISNPNDIVDFATKICQNIGEMWAKADNKVKRKIQELVFPDGVEYSKDEDIYRTNRINTIIGLIASYGTSEKDYTKKADQGLVPQSAYSLRAVRRGIEPFLFNSAKFI